MTDWHRYVGAGSENRTTGKAITGASNLAFLFIVVSGIYLWWPRSRNFQAIRSVTWFRRGLTGKARDFNWHNVIGIWSASVLVVLTFTAMGISFPKTYEVIYSVTGIERPPTPQNAPAPGARANTSAGPRELAPPPPPATGLDRVWMLAETQMPSWRSINMRLPQLAGQPVVFTMNDRDRLNPMARSTLTASAETVQVLRWEPYEKLTTGQRLRTWMRFGHTGELWGLPAGWGGGLGLALARGMGAPPRSRG